MADVRVEIDEAAVHAMFSDWDSPVGQYIEKLTQEVDGAAQMFAPVSMYGSEYAPPGYLKSRIRTARQHHPDGTLLGMVGIPLVKGSRYPLPFVNNPKGETRNANKIAGVVRHYGYRRADNEFLLKALNTIWMGL